MIQIKYQTNSRAKRERTERIQLIAAGFTLFIVMMDSAPNPSKTMTILRAIAAVLGFSHLLCGLRYGKAQALFGDHFEKVMAWMAGFVLIFGGIMLRMEGSQSAYLVQILVGLFYITGLPILIRRSKGKFGLIINEHGLTYRRMFRKEKVVPWKDVEAVGLSNELLSITRKKTGAKLKFYLVEENIPLSDVHRAVNNYLTA